MEMTFTEKDFYAEHFVSKDYLETYYTFSPGKDAENALLTFSLKNLHKAFILDIVATDYTSQNREELQRWLKKEPEAFDWSPVVKYVCKLEGDREKWAEKEEKVRRAIKQVLKCDVTQANPLAPLDLPPADCLLSSLCLEGACKDLSTYRSALKNISSLVKPGGHLVLFAILEETFYMIGRRPFSCLYLETKFVEEALKEAGFAIKWLKETRIDFAPSVTDANGACTVVAQKC